MPQVPVYDNLRQARGPTPGPSISGPAPGALAGEQIQRQGSALVAAGGAMQRVMLDEIEQQNQVRVADAMNQAVAARLRLTHDKDVGYAGLQGRGALERPDGQALDVEFSGKFEAEVGRIAESLGNDAQKRAFGVQTAQLAAQFRAGVSEHMMREARQFAVSTQAGTIKVASDMMALEPYNTEALAQGQNAIKAAMTEMGRLQGWSPAETLAKTVEALSVAHRSVLATAVQDGRVDFAREYMGRVTAELTPGDRLDLQRHLAAGEQAVQASQGAADVWAKHGPGRDLSAPVDVAAMEQAVRDRFANDPAKAKLALAEIRERASAHNASQREFHAKATTDVYRMLDAGRPLNEVRRSAAWQQLPGDQQHRVVLQLEQEAAARASRAASAEAQAAAREGRELQRLQRQQQMMLLTNAGAYLRYSDPQVLARMSRPEVEATRAHFGLDGAQHLLQRWDQLQKPGKVAEARMDTEDFNHVASQMGLKPFEQRKSDKEREQLGELKFRVEQLIDRAQAGKGGELTRVEKMEVMRQEMARVVGVERWWAADAKVPVIQLTPDQVAKVRVPPTERAQIVQALKAAADRDPTNPAFAPTEENVRRLYLRGQSPAAGLIPPAR